MTTGGEERPAARRSPPSVPVAPFHKPLTVVHLATSEHSKRTRCRRRMNPDDAWLLVEDTEGVPVCRRCQGLPPLVYTEDPLFT